MATKMVDAKLTIDQKENVLHCYWMMMRSLEHHAETERGVLARHEVEAYYRLWNNVMGTELQPSWLRNPKPACTYCGKEGDLKVTSGDCKKFCDALCHVQYERSQEMKKNSHLLPAMETTPDGQTFLRFTEKEK